MSIVVVIPSRGRPDRALEAVHAIRETAVLVSTAVVVAVDEDDPKRTDYGETFRRAQFDDARHRLGPLFTLVSLRGRDTGNLVRATNTVSMRIARDDPDAIIGNLGDDHRTRTPGWDRMVTEALAEPGIAYGRDGIQDERLPTAPFISARIVLALGWYALPRLEHMYIDDVWRELGNAAGVLRYLPDMLIEHMHPAVGKADWDEGYIRVNDDEAITRDRARYHWWRGGHGRFGRDVAKVRRACT